MTLPIVSTKGDKHCIHAPAEWGALLDVGVPNETGMCFIFQTPPSKEQHRLMRCNGNKGNPGVKTYLNGRLPTVVRGAR